MSLAADLRGKVALVTGASGGLGAHFATLLAASGAGRLAAAPDVPTVSEAGVKGYDMSFWFAVYGPAGMPAAVVGRLNEAFGKASASPEVQAFQAKTSGEVAFSTPEALARFQAAESQKWDRVIRAAGIQPQ